MGMFDKRREDLGIASVATSSVSSKSGSSSGSAFANRRASIEKEREVQRQASIKRAEQAATTSKKITLPTLQDQLRTATTAFTPQSVNTDLRPMQGPAQPTNLQNRASINAELPGRDIPVLGLGLRAVDKLQELTQPAAKVAEQLYTPGAGITAIGGATAATGNLISKLAPKLGMGSGALPTIGREVIKESVVGAPLAAGQSLASNPEGGLTEAANQAKWGALFGAAGGGLLAGAAKGAGAVANSFGEQAISNMLQSSKAIQQAGDSLSTGRLKLGNNETYVNKVMSDIKPIVFERMTPPLENPNELAKWIKPHLGDVSLNDVRKLSYEDMSQLATEVQRNASMFDVAKQAAKERGYNLDDLLNGKSPNVRKEADRLRMGRVAGAIDAPQNARVALSNKDSLLPAAPTSAPKEHWFNKLFGDKSIGITPGANGQELIDTQIVSRAKERTSLVERAENLASATNEDYIDRFVPFKQIDKETYDAAMDSTRANNLANVTIKDKFVDLEGNVLGKSLKDVYATVPRGKKNIADRYVIMRDAISRMDRGLKVYGNETWFPQSGTEAAAMLSQLEARNPWLKQFGDDWNQFNGNRQDLWVQSGIASPELIGVLRNSNPNYAPMMRQVSKTNLKNRLAFNSSRSGFSGQRAPIQRAVGSTKKIIEPAQGMIESTGASYNAMMRNRAMVKLHDAIKADPDKYKGVIEIVEETADMKKATLKAINEALEDNGPDGVAAMLNDELNGLFKKAKQATGDSQATVTVMLEGNPVKLRVSDPSLLKAIEGISPEQLNDVVKIVNGLSKLIKQSATGLLAPLQGAKLALRDMPIAAAQSKNKKMFLADISHAMVSQIADWLPSFVPGAKNVGKLAREYYRAGGGYEAYLKGDSKIRSVSADITRDPILSGRNALKTIRNYNPLRPLKALGDAMENIPRISAFNAEMRKTGWSRDPENVRAAVDAAREATVNWSRRGHRGANIEAFLPYSNAAVQGTYRLVKRFKEQPVSAVALILGIAGAKIAAYEKYKNDPDFQQRSRFEKGIPVGKTADGKFRTIPVEPTEAYIADQILNFYKWAKDGQDLPGVKENIQEGANAFLPKYLAGPAAAFTNPERKLDPVAAVKSSLGGSSIEPVVSVFSGQNYFGGDVVPREYQGLPRNMQQNETTSAAANWAAENMGIDAFTFDYLAQKFGGDLAKVGLPMTSTVGKGDPVGNAWDETLTKLKLLEDPVMKNRISEDYYGYATSVSQAKAANTVADKPLPNWYQTAYDEVTSTKKGSISSRVSELNSSKKETQRNPLLTAKDRSDKLRDIQREINFLRIQGMKRLEELGVPKTKE
ncbi:hypothetical protein BK133_00765 [Paenibacillus sp. FSL H8-0548]|uniref:LPD38 domain-containing protein n=1 Tax=Paenibacillus sp. FSL H8-0548 TaxID=1920422 RepID=UPI00096E5432|nr:LPD38 domain-containing protein [Paenibacillus sp. FSL H8-0548]OMF38768.1 hypothetical protein BK133_00765 [Paenibacillus sp. FSL H8-0548]